MPVIKAKSGLTVQIGSFQGGYPVTDTFGRGISVADAGVPLLDYSPLTTDPLTIWKSQPAVRKVVGFAAKQFAQIPWHAYQEVQDNDRQRRRNSPAEKIMREPFPLLSGFNFWSTMVTDRLLYDACLAVLTDDGLIRVPPRRIIIRSDEFGLPRQILMAAPAGMDDVDVTNAPKIATWGWHADKAGGVSPMHTLASILEESLRAVEWRSAQWKNSPKLSGLLMRPKEAKEWKPEQRERFLEAWRAWRSQEKAGGTPILEGGMEYQQLDGLTPKDAQDIEGRQLTDIEVATAFHIPPELIGTREGKFASIEAWRQMLFGPTLGPLAVEMQQAVNAGGVIPSLDSTSELYLELDRDSVAAGSFFEKARTLQTLTGGPVMTRAEARTMLNLPHLDGTDDLLVPLNVLRGGQASPTDSGDQNAGTDNEQREEEKRTTS